MQALLVLLACVALSPAILAAATSPAIAGNTPGPSTSGGAPAPRASSIVLRPMTPAPTVSLTRTPPDPPPTTARDQWVYDLRYSAGDLYLLGIHRLELPAPQATPRAMGRFAIELYEGTTLLERARFDFPMLGDGRGIFPAPAAPGGAPEGGTKLPIEGRPITLNITSRVGVMFPAVARGTRVEIVDRAYDRHWPLPWPPTEMTAEIQDAGSSVGD
jgi:hypothetical protein